jgi:hypothetical protein
MDSGQSKTVSENDCRRDNLVTLTHHQSEKAPEGDQSDARPRCRRVRHEEHFKQLR